MNIVRGDIADVVRAAARPRRSRPRTKGRILPVAPLRLQAAVRVKRWNVGTTILTTSPRDNFGLGWYMLARASATGNNTLKARRGL